MPFTLPWKRNSSERGQHITESSVTTGQKLPIKDHGIDEVVVMEFAPYGEVDKIVTLLVIGAGKYEYLSVMKCF